uniref:Uncharacterized protein n=1 Tax=Zea mays TaxID=4577 RepID=B4FCV3_MAIZE|nr:unknown [Zea mays]
MPSACSFFSASTCSPAPRAPTSSLRSSPTTTVSASAASSAASVSASRATTSSARSAYPRSPPLRRRPQQTSIPQRWSLPLCSSFRIMSCSRSRGTTGAYYRSRWLPQSRWSGRGRRIGLIGES